MRGSDRQTGSLFSYVNLEERIPARHPLRKIKGVVDAALVSLDSDFALLYADECRPSIAPERLLRASLVQILCSIRSERQLMEQLQYNLLFRWFVGLSIDEPVWVPTVFAKNRDRLLSTEMSQKLLTETRRHGSTASQGPSGTALLHGTSDHREPARLRRRDRADACGRHGRAARRARHDRVRLAGLDAADRHPGVPLRCAQAPTDGSRPP
jgi:transposase